MKLVLRTLAILAAALVVVAGVYALGQSRFGQQLGAAGPGRGGLGREGGPPPGFEGREGAPAGLPAGIEGRGGHGGDGPSLAGLAQVGKNLMVVAVCVALVSLGTWMLQRGRRREGKAEG